ncbi:MAG: DUF72 domain-containing protein [Bryobacterales bacterium]
MSSAQLFAGTSGFAYPSWKPDFYPAKVPQAKFLEHYATRLNSVEINYTFRRNPTVSTLEKWIAAVPENFRFSVKAHQRITHFARLKPEAKEATDFFLRAIDPLHEAGKLGVVLFQLPPNLKLDLERLEGFLPNLPQDMRCAFEFRNESWYDEAVYALLKAHNVCLCQAESDTLETPPALTADFVYFRLRKSDYSAEERAEIRTHVDGLLGYGRTVFLYFKHEDTPAGALYAEEMLTA